MRALALSLTILITGCTDRVVLVGQWFDLAWSTRLPITFSQTDRNANLTDFPVLLVLDPARIDYARVAADGRDLRAVERATGRVLPLEIEAWAPGGTSYLWLLAPTIPAEARVPTIDLYFGNSLAQDQQDPRAVFGNGFVSVHHLEDALWDSGPAHNDGTNIGSTAADGRIAAGRHFVRDSDQRIEIGTTDLATGTDPRTICGWANPDNLAEAAHYTVAAYGGSIGTDDASFFLIRYGDRYQCGGGPDDTIVMGNEPIAAGDWHYLCCTYDGSQASLYVDAALETQEARHWVTTRDEALIGGDSSGLDGENWDGILDEVRFSRVARPLAWIDAEYRSMTDTLVQYGTLETL